jgi:hypothetical protein
MYQPKTDQDQEKAIDNFSKVEDLVLNYPLPLLKITSPVVLKAIDNYLPYSVGMEFECYKNPEYREADFTCIPNIMDVNVDDSEQRYRIPPGLKGLICLYRICETLKIYSALDLRSSNHYHTDMSDVWNALMFREDETNFQREWIQEELKKWGTAKELDRIRSWYRFNSLKTLEIRIGEPTFDYKIVVKRLIDCARITKHLKNILAGNKLDQLTNQLNSLEEPPKKKEQKDIKSIIKQRQININETENRNRDGSENY